MNYIVSVIESSLPASIIAFIVSFVILNKCADFFVDSSATIAKRFHIPEIVIGIILVSFATTAPELSVSLMSALSGKPEIALGNAIGSVICNTGLALGLAGILAFSPIPVKIRDLKISGSFLAVVSVLIFLFIAPDYTLQGWEGGVLLGLYAVYMFFVFKKEKGITESGKDEKHEESGQSVFVQVLLFALGLAGIIFSSKLIVASAVKIASSAGIPDTVIALTMVALGTSIPEVATCVVSVRKKHGAIAVGNILGANILNISWVAGASSLANDLIIDKRQTYFMFPFLFVFVGAMIFMLRSGKRLTKSNGYILLALYLIYLAAFAFVFPIGA